MHKKACDLAAGLLSQNVRERTQAFCAMDDAFNFMNTFNGTPGY